MRRRAAHAPDRSPRRRLAVGAALCGLLALLGCAGGRLALPGDLRVGIQTDYPPLAFRSGQEIVGVEADFARLVGRALDRRVRLVELDRQALLPALEDGRVDVVMAGLSITPERSERVRFVEPYVRVGQMVLLRRDRLLTLGRRSALREPGMRIGFVAGTTGESFVRERLSDAVPVPLDSIDAGPSALREGRIDFFVHDAPTIWRLGMDPAFTDLLGVYRPLTDEWLAWAVSPKETALAERLDRLVETWLRDGTIDRVLDAWVPVRIVQ